VQLIDVVYVTNLHYLGDKANESAHAAMEHWMNKTCVKFIPRSNQADYILFVEEYG